MIEIIFYTFIGSVAGLFIGAIPGLSVTMATALLVSFTYGWNTYNAIAMIMGIYVVGVFSGAISAVAFNIPGAPSSVITALDGHKLAKKIGIEEALKIITKASVFGSIFGIVGLFIVAKPLSIISIYFRSIDYFIIALFGLISCVFIASSNKLKALMVLFLGMIISFIGMDDINGYPVMTFGVNNLLSGISLVPALIGLFGLSEVLFELSSNSQLLHSNQEKRNNNSLKFRNYIKLTFISSLIGTIVGALPGAGSPVASFLSYIRAKKAFNNDEFGEGSLEGVIASEAANNACIGGALIPMLSFGIPGDSVTSVILAIFMIHGLNPGPTFLDAGKSYLLTIVISGLIASVFLYFLGIYIAPKISKLISIPKSIIMPIIVVLCVVGSYANNSRYSDILIMLGFGIFGYFLKVKKYPIPPLVLSLVLTKMMINQLIRAISISSSADNFIYDLLFKPITISLLGVILFTFVFSKYRNLK